MLQYFDTLTDDSGNALFGATVQVLNWPALTNASIFATNGTSSPIANNTVAADITGQVSFFIPDGAYQLVYSYKGTQYKTRAPVQVTDPLSFVKFTDQGAANAYVITDQRLPAQLYVGLKLELVVGNSNTGASTLNMNATGAIPIVQSGGTALSTGNLVATGIYRFEYDGTNWQLVSMQPVTTALFNAFLQANASYIATLANIVTLQGQMTGVLQGMNDQDNLDLIAAELQAGTAVTLATFGDSTMWGANVSNLATQVPSPPYAVLQGTVNNVNGNNACSVTNYAISGTTLAQMLAGTDGSGLTFAQRIAAFTGPVVYCNHGVNDANGANSTTAAVYHANLLTYIQIVRAAGKIPVLVTPHACHSLGALGTYLRAAATAQFARIMRLVAQQHGVFLVDTFDVLLQIMDTDAGGGNTNAYAPLSILPDGVHGPQATYSITGVQLAEAIIGSQIPTLTAPGQVLTAARALGQGSGLNIVGSTSSRYGAYLTTGSTNPQSLAICFRVARTGMDISILAPISSLGATNIAMQLDGGGNIGAAVYSQGLAGWTSAGYVQDFETLLVRNITPGLHLLTMQSASTGTISYSGIKSRQYKQPIQVISVTPQANFRELFTPLLELPAASGLCSIFENMPAESMVDGPYFEFTASLPINCGLCIGGYYGTSTGTSAAQPMIAIGLNASGFIQVQQATGPGTFSSTVLGSTNLAGASHVYQALVQPSVPSTVTVFVDGVSQGAVNLASPSPYNGGWLGIYKALAATDLVLTNVNRIRVELN